MRIAIIADTFPPLRTSGAVQIRDLCLEFVRQGHETTMMIPSPEIQQPWLVEDYNGVQVLRLKAPRTKDIGYVRRTINEFLMPFVMLYNLRKSPLAKVRWDGVVWYSPTIFLGPIAKALKKTSACRSYLIVRDIFPEWAVDMGLMGRGLPYRFFKAIERYQYSAADVIGVQTPGNLPYIDACNLKPGQRVEVLHNWLADAPSAGCSISLSDTDIAGRTLFVYAGNMGVAQGMQILLDVAERLLHRQDVGFVFVGRGSDAKMLRAEAQVRKLDNVVFHDEIDPSEIPGLYEQCHIGVVALDPRHKTHNIPGKFLSYMQAGLPVLANINSGNDLESLIKREKVGRVCVENSVEQLVAFAEQLVDELVADIEFSVRCKRLSANMFSAAACVKQVSLALKA